MPVVWTKAGLRCNGIPVRIGVRIGSPLANCVRRSDNELSTCLNCGQDIWVVIGMKTPDEGHACTECTKNAEGRRKEGKGK